MPKLNENYRKLKDSYLFAEIAHRTAAYMEKHSDQSLIRLLRNRRCYKNLFVTVCTGAP